MLNDRQLPSLASYLLYRPGGAVLPQIPPHWRYPLSQIDRIVLTDKEAGLLVPPKDMSALTEAIVQLLQDPDRREEMGWRGRIRAQAFDWSRIAERALRYYAERRSSATRCVDEWEVEHAHG